MYLGRRRNGGCGKEVKFNFDKNKAKINKINKLRSEMDKTGSEVMQRHRKAEQGR